MARQSCRFAPCLAHRRKRNPLPGPAAIPSHQARVRGSSRRRRSEAGCTPSTNETCWVAPASSRPWNNPFFTVRPALCHGNLIEIRSTAAPPARILPTSQTHRKANRRPARLLALGKRSSLTLPSSNTAFLTGKPLHDGACHQFTGICIFSTCQPWARTDSGTNYAGDGSEAGDAQGPRLSTVMEPRSEGQTGRELISRPAAVQTSGEAS